MPATKATSSTALAIWSEKLLFDPNPFLQSKPSVLAPLPKTSKNMQCVYTQPTYAPLCIVVVFIFIALDAVMDIVPTTSSIQR